MQEKVFYFGYGANSQREMMKAITGNKDLKGIPATLSGVALYVQRLDQVPDRVVPTSPEPISPKASIKKHWSGDFTTYMIKPKENSFVKGTVWELNRQERELVREWEMVDFGWYKDMKGKAIADDGREIEIETEGWREGQEVEREIDGKNYTPFLNKLEDFQRVADKTRRGYFERIK